MTTSILAMSLALVLGQAGQCPGVGVCPHAGHPGHSHGYPKQGSGGFIMPDGPGDGWGFPNGNPDGYGWHNIGESLPLGANRTSEYYIRRYWTIPPEQAFMPTYYNPYINRGQRYIPYVGNGGMHPMGGPPLDTAQTPMKPYSSLTGDKPVTAIPSLRGQVQGSKDTSGKTGLTP